MPLDMRMGFPVDGHPIEHRRVGDFARRHLPGTHAEPIEQIDRLEGERRAEEHQPSFHSVPREAFPLLLGELKPLPVVVTGFILPAELHPEWLERRALRVGEVGLEFDCIRSRLGYRIDERVSGS